MSESNNIIITKRISSTIEINRSSPNLNTISECEYDFTNIYKDPKMVGNESSLSTSKSQQTISVSISMQANNVNINNTTLIGQLETPTEETSIKDTFKQISRRESSLENLAEDDTNTQNNNSSTADNLVTTYIVQTPTVNDNIRVFTRKVDSSSRFRRTIHSLFSCCSIKSKRSQFISCGVGVSDGFKDSDIGCHHVADKNSNIGCLKLRKFFDMLDESDTAVKRVQSRKQTLLSVPYRDGDKKDSPCHRNSGEIKQWENGGTNLARPVLLGPIKLPDQGKKCFIIDLDETLVHSSFKMVNKADFKVGVDIEGTVHTVYVLKRPHVDIFLQKMGLIFECVLFTASLAKYADPVTDFLDKWRVFRWRLFRESCVFHRGNYVKDLGMLGRPADQVAILDNSPASYMFHPDSAVQITSWFDDPKDTALLDLIPYFEQLAQAPSVPPFLSHIKPPQKATVPVTVMLSLPCSSASSPPPTINPAVSQSSSPIASVVPVTPILTEAIQLPFSRNSGVPLSQAMTQSLSSLPSSLSKLHPRRSHSDSSLHHTSQLLPSPPSFLLIAAPLSSLSKSLPHVPLPLSSDSPSIMFHTRSTSLLPFTAVTERY